MAKPATTWEGRRALTDNPDTSPDTYKKAARELMEQNLIADAATFFSLAGDEDGLLEILEIAVKEGNFFIFNSAVSRLGADKISRDQVQALKTAAEANGHGLYASQAAKYLSENF